VLHDVGSVRDAVVWCNGCLPACYVMVIPEWELSRSAKVACLRAAWRRVRKGRRRAVQWLIVSCAKTKAGCCSVAERAKDEASACALCVDGTLVGAAAQNDARVL